jgi:Glycosyl hydrolase family 12
VHLGQLRDRLGRHLGHRPPVRDHALGQPHGSVGPIGTWQANVTLGGHNWNVYKGTNGSNQVFSFLRTSNSNSGTVDGKPILNWIAYTTGWMPGNETIGDVQFGYEITSSSSGLNFNTNSLTIKAAD